MSSTLSMATTTHGESTDQARRSIRMLPLLAALLGAMLLLSACNEDLENRDFAMVNQLRSSVGVPALSRAGELDAKAQQQADRMAKRGKIYHSKSLSSGVSVGWSSIGENVAVAGSVEDAQKALEASSGHYDNMVNSGYTEMGVGISLKNGSVYMVQVFVGR